MKIKHKRLNRIKKHRSAKLITALCLILFLPICANAGVVVMTPSDDAMIVKQQPYLNQGALPLLKIQPDKETQRALVKFDFSAYAINASNVESAMLSVHVEYNDGNFENRGNAADIRLHRMKESWQETSVAWRCDTCSSDWDGGNYADKESDRVRVSDIASGTIQFDVTKDVKAWLNNEESNNGWLIKKQRESKGGIIVLSAKEGSHAPQLILSLDTQSDVAPPSVAIVKPAGGLLIGDDAPVFNAIYSDDTSISEGDVLIVLDDAINIGSYCNISQSASSCTLTGLMPGIHVLEVAVWDSVGNASSDSLNFLYLDSANRDGFASKWHTGSGLPEAAFGSNSDLYLNEDNADVYKKENGNWVLSLNIQGSQGEQGLQGQKGRQGEKGDTGAVGQTGSKGNQGLQGMRGFDGPKGNAGLQGIPGAIGQTGEKGEQGDAGIKYVAVSCNDDERVVGFGENGQLICAVVAAGGGEGVNDLGKLNDTGMDVCWSDADSNLYTCPQNIVIHGQDGDYGRDVLAQNGDLIKEGSGPVGFDLTKIDMQGNDLPEEAEIWRCLRDNVTGLIWEVKSNQNDVPKLQYAFEYYWYDTDDGDVFTGSKPQPGSCGGIDCNTEAYVVAINALNLCGINTWHIPTVHELHSVIDYGYSLDSEPYMRGLSINSFKQWSKYFNGTFWSSSYHMEQQNLVNSFSGLVTLGSRAEKTAKLILVTRGK